MNEAEVERERRSFNRLELQLSELGICILRLLMHIDALSTITGISDKEELGPSPRPGEDTSHMENVITDVVDFKHWIKTLDGMFEHQLSELVPGFYSEPEKSR